MDYKSAVDHDVAQLQCECVRVILPKTDEFSALLQSEVKMLAPMEEPPNVDSKGHLGRVFQSDFVFQKCYAR